MENIAVNPIRFSLGLDQVDGQTLNSVAAARLQLNKFAESYRPALQRFSDASRHMEENLRPALQRFSDANLHMEESLRPALQGLNVASHRIEESFRPLAGAARKLGRCLALQFKCFGQIDLAANLRAGLLRTSAPLYDVEAHRPKGGSKPLWLRDLIGGLISMFIRFQNENSGRKLLKIDFKQYLYREFPVSFRTVEEIWKHVRGEWKSGGRPREKTLAEKISQPELEAFFFEFRRGFVNKIDN